MYVLVDVDEIIDGDHFCRRCCRRFLMTEGYGDISTKQLLYFYNTSALLIQYITSIKAQ